MTSVTHKFVSVIADDAADAAAGKVTPTRWNDDHSVSFVAADIAGLGFITSASVATALAPYLTSGSAASAYQPVGDYVGSASLQTVLAPYLTSASAALVTYVTSSSLLTALGPYLTSASAALGTYVTSDSMSAVVKTDLLNVKGSASFSKSAHFRSNISVSGAANLMTTLSVSGNADFRTNVTVSGALTALTTVSVSGNADFRAAVTVSGALNALTTMSVSGNAVFKTSIAVSATASVGALTIAGAAFDPAAYLSSASARSAISTDVLNVSLTASVGQLYVAGTSTLSGAVNALSTMSVSGDANFKKSVNVSATLSCGFLTVGGSAIVSGEGSVSISTMITTALGPYLTSASARSAVSTDVLNVSLTASVGQLYVAGTSTHSGASNFLTTISVSGNAAFVTTASFASGVEIHGTTTLSGAVSVLTTLSVSGQASFKVGIDVSATASIGQLYVAGTATVSGALNVLTTMSVSGQAVFKTGITVSATVSCGALTVGGSAIVSGEGSVSISNMIITALGPYLTSASARSAVSTDVLNVSLTASVGQLYVAGTSTHSGASNFLTTMSVSGNATFKINVDVSATLSCGFLTAVGAVNFKSTLSVSGDADFRSAVTVSGALNALTSMSVSGQANFKTDVNVSATVSAGAVTVGGFPLSGYYKLGSASGVTTTQFKVSGTWTNFNNLHVQATGKGNAGSRFVIFLYTDGGTTALTSLNIAGTASATSSDAIAWFDITGVNVDSPLKYIEGRCFFMGSGGLPTLSASATTTTAALNCIGICMQNNSLVTCTFSSAHVNVWGLLK